MTFVNLAELTDRNANGICAAIKKSLKNNGLELQNLVVIGTDNVSVMTGVTSGVYAKLKLDVCHSLQLAVSHATVECLPRNLDVMVREI